MMGGGGGNRSGARDCEGEWEVRPGGMLVQRRDGDAGPAVRLRVSHVAAFRDVPVPAQATFATYKSYESVARVRTEVDKLSAKVCELEKSVLAGRKVEDKEFVVLTELLMMQLLKLNGIDAEGEARAQRKAEVRRVQSLAETLDKLKARNGVKIDPNSFRVHIEYFAALC